MDFQANKAVITFKYLYVNNNSNVWQTSKYIVIEDKNYIEQLITIVGNSKKRVCTCGSSCNIDFYYDNKLTWKYLFAKNHKKQFQASTVIPKNIKEDYVICSVTKEGKELLDYYYNMLSVYCITTGKDTLYLNQQ
jgi:hypothetical protein